MDFKTAIKAIMTAKSEEAGSFSPDELARFRAGLLEPEDFEDLLERAAVSPRTADALRDTSRFPDVEPADERQRMSEEDLDRHWRRFEQRLSNEVRLEAQAPVVKDRRGISRRWRWLSSLAGSARVAQAAAALLLVSLGLSWWGIDRGPGSEGIQPRLNLPIVELVPTGESGQRTDVQAIELPAGADGFFLVLTLRDPRRYPIYEARIEGPSGTELWSSAELERAEEGFFTLELPRGFLPPGRYRIVLSGVNGERRDRLAIYELAIGP